MNPLTTLSNTVLYYPLLNTIVFLEHLTHNFGWAIIILTIGLRFLMTPLVLPGLKLSKKMQELAPELKKLQVQYKDDKQGLVKAQTQLYSTHKINPAAGCLPQIIQLVILITLFNALNFLLKSGPSGLNISELNKVLYTSNQVSADYKLSTKFAYLSLDKPDRIPNPQSPIPGVFLIAAALVQLLSSKMMMPAVKKEAIIAQKTEDTKDDMMAGVQEQMLYMFPIMTIIVGYSFPSGLALYWLLFSAISMFQQYSISGWGGLTPWLNRFHLLKSHNKNP